MQNLDYVQVCPSCVTLGYKEYWGNFILGPALVITCEVTDAYKNIGHGLAFCSVPDYKLIRKTSDTVHEVNARLINRGRKIAYGRAIKALAKKENSGLIRRKNILEALEQHDLTPFSRCHKSAYFKYTKGIEDITVQRTLENQVKDLANSVAELTSLIKDKSNTACECHEQEWPRWRNR